MAHRGGTGNSFQDNIQCFQLPDECRPLGPQPAGNSTAVDDIKRFAKLSAQQWQILYDHVIDMRWGGPESRLTRHWTDRSRVYSESERVSTVRAISSLVRRGLLKKGEKFANGHQTFELAVPPRMIANAADDLSITAIDVESLRWHVGAWNDGSIRK